jgi:hypothetical protein
VLERTEKRAGKAYINGRVAKANGLSVQDATALTVNDTKGDDTIYKRTDIAYDIRTGLLRFKQVAS